MKRLSIAAMVLGAVLSASVVQAAVLPNGGDLVYEGSFNLPNHTTEWGYQDHYARGITFVPAGTARPGSSETVTGPTILVQYDWGGHICEYTIPALSKIAGSLNTASGIPNASGGTNMSGRQWIPNSVDVNGVFWCAGPSGISSPAFYSKDAADSYELGTNALGVPDDNETGWLETWPPPTYMSNYQSGGVLRLGDGAGGDYPNDGHAYVDSDPANSAHFIGAANISGGPGYWNYVSDNYRTGATTYVGGVATVKGTVTGSLMFAVWQEDYPEGQTNLEYVRDQNGDEWVILVNQQNSAPDGSGNYNIAVFPASTTGEVKREDFGVNIGADIAANAGWLGSDCRDVAIDWANNQMYVIDQSGQNARVHVFTFAGVPEPATLALLGLGFVGIAALRRRRR